MASRSGNPYGFKATFNPTYPTKSTNPFGWVSPFHFGINQGPIVLMIENYRTCLLWKLMRDCPYIVTGFATPGLTEVGYRQTRDEETARNHLNTLRERNGHPQSAWFEAF